MSMLKKQPFFFQEYDHLTDADATLCARRQVSRFGRSAATPQRPVLFPFLGMHVCSLRGDRGMPFDMPFEDGSTIA